MYIGPLLVPFTCSTRPIFGSDGPEAESDFLTPLGGLCGKNASDGVPAYLAYVGDCRRH